MTSVTETQAILDALLSRRSIRYGFEERAVTRDVLEQVVACGLAAPSSKNAQPWRFHIVTARAFLERFSRRSGPPRARSRTCRTTPARPALPQYTSTVLDSADVLLDVPATVWIENLGAFSAGRQTLLNIPKEALAGSLEGYGLELIGIGAAIENMWVAANALGLARGLHGRRCYR